MKTCQRKECHGMIWREKLKEVIYIFLDKNLKFENNPFLFFYSAEEEEKAKKRLEKAAPPPKKRR